MINFPSVTEQEVAAVKRMSRAESDSLKEQIKQCDPTFIFGEAKPSTNPDKKFINCPICGNGTGEDKTPVEVTCKDGTWLYNCFCGCGFSGDLIKIIADAEHLNVKDGDDFCKILAIGASLIGYTLEEEGKSSKPSRPKSSPASKTENKKPPINEEELKKLIRSDIERAQENLDALPKDQRRGLNGKTLAHFGFGYIEKWVAPNMRNQGEKVTPSRRIIIPSLDETFYHAIALPEDRLPADNPKEKKAKLSAGKMTDALFNKNALKADTIIIFEGEIDAASVWQVYDGKIAVVAVLGCQNWHPTLLPLLERLHDKNFIIVFDGDPHGRNAAENLRGELMKRGFPAVCRFYYDALMTRLENHQKVPFEFTDKIDANDILRATNDFYLKELTQEIIDSAQEDLAAAKEEIASRAQNQSENQPPAQESAQELAETTADVISSCPAALKIPEDFIFSSSGIIFLVRSKRQTREVVVTRTPIIPTKIFRAPKQSTFTYEMAIFIRGVWRKTEISGKTLADSRAIIDLADKGALILEPKLLCRFLNDIISLNPDLQEVKAYDQPGWHDGNFIYPTGGDDYIVRRAGFNYADEFATRGSADILKEYYLKACKRGGAIARLFIGNALVAPLIQPLNLMNAQIQLNSKSGSGKTALMKLTAALFGNPRELIRTFAATEKNRQAVAAAYNDLPTFLDEMETMNGKRAEEQLSQMIYSFAEGKANQAQKRDGTARQAFKFFGTRLMTAERPILKDNDLRGAFKRLVQIRCPKLFDDNFAAQLHYKSETNFGHFGKMWTDFVAEHIDEIRYDMDYFMQRIFVDFPQKTEPTQLKAITIAAIATEYFLVCIGEKENPDCEVASKDIKEIIKLLPASSDLDDTARALENLSSFVVGHIKNFDRPLKNEAGAIEEISAWGTECFGRIFKNGEVAFLPPALKKILEEELKFASADKLIAEWREQGNVLITDKERVTHKVFIGDNRARAIHFKAQILVTTIEAETAAYYDEKCGA